MLLSCYFILIMLLSVLTKSALSWSARSSLAKCTGVISTARLSMKSSETNIDGRNLISWYPGHIAKAERELSDYLKKVDVVIEVIDARIPFATTHPMVPQWVGSKPLIIAIARLDQVSPSALREWKKYYAHNPVHPERPDAKIYFVNGKLGAGVLSLKRQALKAGEAINERRQRRGIQPRAVRAAVIGFPNVGKSALINRLLGRKMAKSRNLPGVTRALQWVRIGGLQGPQGHVLELLDSPGIIPARQFDQDSALKLAICNDIGEASYDRVVVAAAMCDQVNALFRQRPSYVNMRLIEERYRLPFRTLTGEEIVYQFAEVTYKGNSVSAADKLLGDFRKDMLEYASLEAPPSDRLQAVSAGADLPDTTMSSEEDEADSEHEDVALMAPASSKSKKDVAVNLDIGKGDYDGW